MTFPIDDPPDREVPDVADSKPWHKWADLAFDVFSIVLSVMDVISDVFVSIQFYQEGETFFFMVSVVILFVAQIVYACQFERRFMWMSEQGRVQRVCRRVLVIAFGQLVPLLLWSQSKNLERVELLLRAVGCYSLQSGPISRSDDALEQRLQRKLVEHAGFLVEAAVEAIPQSLLQMAYMAMRGKATPLNVFSIVSSLATVCSKASLFFFSIHPLMMLFCVCCICADVLCLFATVSFLAMPVENANTYNVFGYTLQTSFATYVWVIKEALLIAVMVWGGLTYFVVTAKQGFPRRLEHIAGQGLALAGGALSLVPVAIILESCKLLFIPCLVFEYQLKAHRTAPSVSRAFWAFMRGQNVEEHLTPVLTHLKPLGCPAGDDRVRGALDAPKDNFDLPDFERKIRAIHVVAAQAWLSKCTDCKEGQCKLALAMSTGCLKKPVNNDRSGLKSLLFEYFAGMEATLAPDQLKSMGWSRVHVHAFHFAIVPFYLLGNAYSFFYPLLCMFTLKMGLLQQVLGGMYVLSLAAFFLTGFCLQPVFRYFLRVNYLTFLGNDVFELPSFLPRIIELYVSWRESEVIYDALHSAVPFPSAWETKGPTCRSGPQLPHDVALLILGYCQSREGEAGSLHQRHPREEPCSCGCVGIRGR